MGMLLLVLSSLTSTAVAAAAQINTSQGQIVNLASLLPSLTKVPDASGSPYTFAPRLAVMPLRFIFSRLLTRNLK